MWAPVDVVVTGGVTMAEILLLDLPHYPDDRTEWLEGLSNNLGVLALSARVSTVPRPIVSLSADREHFDRDVARLRELVEKTNDLVGDPEQRRLERFDVQRRGSMSQAPARDSERG
jgi:hypothetical protein